MEKKKKKSVILRKDMIQKVDVIDQKIRNRINADSYYDSLSDGNDRGQKNPATFPRQRATLSHLCHLRLDTF